MENLYHAFLEGKWFRPELERHHPNPEFKANYKELPAHLGFLMLTVEKPSDIARTVGNPLHQHPQDLLNFVIQTTGYNKGRLNMDEHMLLMSKLLNTLCKTAEYTSITQAQLKWERPDTYGKASKKIYGDRYGYPSLRASLICDAVKIACEGLDLEPELKEELKDAAYLVSMLSVMAGHNSVRNVLKTLDLKGLWDL